MIPYGRQCLDDDDVAAVVSALRSDFLTTGPAVAAFEGAVAAYVGVSQAVAVASGTAALHAAMHALGIGPGDEVVVPPITFAATANCAVYVGAAPVFADVEPETLLLSPRQVAARITPRTKAVIAVDYAGQTCDYAALRAICAPRGIALVADCCHALGARDEAGVRAGAIADVSVLSFHPVKHITTGEGGMVLTNDPALADRARAFRGHGISQDAAARSAHGPFGTWEYAMEELGYNYRITDLQCALGHSQLRKLDGFLALRRRFAALYDALFADCPGIEPLARRPGIDHAYHLYVTRLPAARRKAVFEDMRRRGFGVNVHYIPVHLHPFYRRTFQTGPGLCPTAEAAYERLLSLPLHPAMAEADVRAVAENLRQALADAPAC